MQTLTIRTPDDWHLHFRDGDMLQETVPATARCFARAIVMPNLVPPVTTAGMAMDYKQRILDARPKASQFEPLMTLYLTNTTTPDDMTTPRGREKTWEDVKTREESRDDARRHDDARRRKKT